MAENQVYHHYPQLARFYTEFERNAVVMQWTDLKWDAAVCAVICYGIFILVGLQVMKTREKFELRRPLQLWNLMLCLFSFMGAIRTMPHLVLTIYKHGLYYSICHNAVESYGAQASGLWTILFILSKIPELGDTVFIVLRKSKLIFLHWYHHITVLLFCWHSLMSQSSAGLYFIAMNYSVHATMYFYYFLAACGIKVWWAKYVTIFQISQMVVGILVNIMVTYYGSQQLDCDVSRSNYTAGLGMYASYFVLFGVLYLNRYLRPQTSKPQNLKKKE